MSSTTWRDILADIMKNPKKKQQLATALRVAPITLQRWIDGEATPRLENFRGLIQHIESPQRTALIASLPENVIQSLGLQPGGEHQELEIPSAIYASVLHTRYSISEPMNFRTLCEQILQNALRQLDPQRYGLEISIVTCMPPSKDGMVLSLREQMGRGTPPWQRQLEDRVLFLGVESLAGYVITTGRFCIVKRQTTELFPALWVEGEESAMACPFMHKNRIGGCLLVSSTQPEYFDFPARVKLVRDYAELLSTAFDPSEFYSMSTFALRSMPPYEQQQPFIATFRKRVNETMRLHWSNEHSLSIQQAEELVWKEIERELILYSATQ